MSAGGELLRGELRRLFDAAGPPLGASAEVFPEDAAPSPGVPETGDGVEVRTVFWRAPGGERWRVVLRIAAGGPPGAAAAAEAIARAACRAAESAAAQEGLCEELGLANECLTAIHEISSDASLLNDLERSLDRVLERIARAAGGGAPVKAAIWRLDAATGVLEALRSLRTELPAPRRASGGVLASTLVRDRCVILNGREILRALSPDEREMAAARSLLVCPLRQPGGTAGLIALWREEGPLFDSRHAGLVEAMGALVVSAVEKDRRVRELIGATVERRELELARRIQTSMLFGRPPKDVPELDVAAIATPARTVGGDFYEFLRLEERSMDVLIGDVMGKGAPAALIGAMVKGMFMRHAPARRQAGKLAHRPLAGIVSAVHREMTPRLVGLESFVTLCYARIDLDARTLTFVNCGHPPILHYRAGLNRVERVDEEDWGSPVNLPLGFREDAVFEEVSVELLPGDSLLFYSDGVTEGLHPENPRAGEAILSDILLFGREASAARILDRVMNSSRTCVRDERLRDDFTCLLVRASGLEPAPLPARVLEIPGNGSPLEAIRTFIEEAAGEIPYFARDPEAMFNLKLCVNEAAANIVKHAYSGDRSGMLRIEFTPLARRLQVRLLDQGRAFHPRMAPAPVFDGSRETGYGVYLMRRFMDKIVYGKTPDGGNSLLLIKDYPPES